MKKTMLGMMTTVVILLSVPSLSYSAQSGKKLLKRSPGINKVIYGTDGRVDVYQGSELEKQWASATAAMIGNSDLKQSRDGYSFQISGPTLGRMEHLCTDQMFRDQLSTPVCSGFLVAEDILITAGHCVQTIEDCQSYSWVFNFYDDGSNQKEIKVYSSDVYKCVDVISQELNEQTELDYSIVRLDRPVAGRKPLKIRTSGEISTKDEVLVIGNPSGLPTKITRGGKVRDISNPSFFVTNLDTFGGNSGSAVLNATTGEIEGILVRGETDYVYHNSNSCMVVNVCTEDGCQGEDVTKITAIDSLLDILTRP